MISNLLIAMLRSVEVVKISFVISVVSLITNGCINYTLIFDILISGDGDQGSSSGNVNCKNAGTIDHCGVCMEDRYESPVI